VTAINGSTVVSTFGDKKSSLAIRNTYFFPAVFKFIQCLFIETMILKVVGSAVITVTVQTKHTTKTAYTVF
jgi:hypothetical protein